MRRFLMFGMIIMALISLGTVMFFGRPGAEVDAIRFGESVHKVIPGNQLSEWAETFRHARPKSDSPKLIIERSEWPAPIRDLLKDHPHAQVFVSFDDSKTPNGLVIQNTIEGIIVPLNGSLPVLDYFSLHRVADQSTYWGFSLYF